MEKVSIGTKLTKLRKQKGVSMQALADYLHVSRQTISKWENDMSLPDIDVLMKLCDYYGVKLNDVLSNNEEDTAEEIYVQLQQVLLNLQTSNQKKHYFNILLLCISIFSMCVSFVTNKNVNTIVNPVVEERPSSNDVLHFNFIPQDSDIFLRQNGGDSYMRIKQIDLSNETITLDYQFALREYTDDTSVILELGNFLVEPQQYQLKKIAPNLFSFKDTIPLDNYYITNLIVNDGNGHYKIENLGIDGNCDYLSFVMQNLPLVYVTTDIHRELILNKIIYEPSLDFAFYDSLFRGKLDNDAEIEITIMDQSKNVILNETVSFCEKTVFRLDKPLPLNTTMYISLSVHSDKLGYSWIYGTQHNGEPFKVIDKNQRSIIYSARKRDY